MYGKVSTAGAAFHPSLSRGGKHASLTKRLISLACVVLTSLAIGALFGFWVGQQHDSQRSAAWHAKLDSLLHLHGLGSSSSSSASSATAAGSAQSTFSSHKSSEAVAAVLDRIKGKNCSGTSNATCMDAQRSALQQGIQLAYSNPELWRLWQRQPAPQSSGYELHASGAQQLVPHPVYGRHLFEPRREPISNATLLHSHWIVITSIQPPTEAIKAWAALPSWRVVVVADTKTPKDWAYPGVVFLSVEAQEKLGYHTLRSLPWRSYTRKMAGYLYAIQHGAQVVYETDDDNAPKQGVGLTWVRHEELPQPQPSTAPDSGAQNPYAYYGQCAIWPRGFPLTDLMQHGSGHCYELDLHAGDPDPRSGSKIPVPIQQALADLDPDVDAIWRLMTPERIGNVRFSSGPGAGGVGLVMSPGSYSPYNSQNTAHMRSAFWALWLPSSVGMRVTDIWRSYWAQRLVWEIGGSVLFLGPTVDQVRNAHDYVVDFRDELQMYAQVPSLIDFLQAWDCTHSHLFDCMLQLGRDMAQFGYWGPSEVESLQAWVLDLASFGYSPPPLINYKARKAQPPQQPATATAMATAAAATAVAATGPAGAATASFEARLPLSELDNQMSGVNRYQRWVASRLQCQRKPGAPPVTTDSRFAHAFPELYMSIVLAASNVNHAGQHGRLSQHLRNIAMYTKELGIQDMIEIIIVDYNSDPSAPPLRRAPSITWPTDFIGGAGPLVRIVVVPQEVHRMATVKMVSHVDPGFWEFMAKNIGMRRACGQWILAANPDMLPNRAFWQTIQARALLPGNQYRAMRLSVNETLPAEATEWPQDKLMAHMQVRWDVICGPPLMTNRTSPVYLEFDEASNYADVNEWLALPFNTSYDTSRGRHVLAGCPGDFTLAERSAMHAIRGYPEMNLPTAMDDTILYALLAHGLQSRIIPPPGVVYHQHHTKNYAIDNKLAMGDPWAGHQVKVKQVLLPLHDGMKTASGAVVMNDEGWGMGFHDLPETVL